MVHVFYFTGKTVSAAIIEDYILLYWYKNNAHKKLVWTGLDRLSGTIFLHTTLAVWTGLGLSRLVLTNFSAVSSLLACCAAVFDCNSAKLGHLSVCLLLCLLLHMVHAGFHRTDVPCQILNRDLITFVLLKTVFNVLKTICAMTISMILQGLMGWGFLFTFHGLFSWCYQSRCENR